MTTPDFQQRHPKPWCFVINGASLSLRDANNKPVACLDLRNFHKCIPQNEWNRHITAAMAEHLPCIPEPAQPEKIAP